MKKTLHFLGIIAVAAMFVLALTTCREPEAPVPVIRIITQPEAVTNVELGNISGSLFVEASVTRNAMPSFQWFKDGEGEIPTAVNERFYIPTDLTEGSHYFRVEVRASGAEAVISDWAQVNVGIAPLTGTVSISGTTEVGQTLTADTSLLGGSGTIYFQWLRNGNGIPGETSGTYVVQNADYGAAITVRVERAFNSGFVHSPPADGFVFPVLPGIVSIIRAAHVGETLTADTSELGGDGDISFRWLRGADETVETEISGANNSTYVLQAADEGHVIRVRVTREFNSGNVTSNPTDPVIWPPIPGGSSVNISGDAVVGETLTANIAGPGGEGTINFQWLRGTTIIEGAASGTYVPQAADVGQRISVRVTWAYNSGSITSAQTAIVTMLEIEGEVRITGSAYEEGAALTADTSALISSGSGTTTFQWLRGWEAIDGATSNTYVVQYTDVGHVIRVRAANTNNSGYVTSNPTAIVNESQLSGEVNITGDAWVGWPLTADTSELGGSGPITFFWMRGQTVITGANSETYVVQAVDLGSTITVWVTRRGNFGSITSDETASITWPPLMGEVNISGTLGVGQTLTADVTGLVGSGDISFQWLRGVNQTEIYGATSSTYIPQAGDVGHDISVRVTTTQNIDSVTSEIVSWLEIRGEVRITGTPVVGDTLTADISRLVGSGSGTITYQWLRNGVIISGAIYTVLMSYKMMI